jgi:hypothetical protein
MENYPHKTSERAERAQQAILDEWQSLADAHDIDLMTHILNQILTLYTKELLAETERLT